MRPSLTTLAGMTIAAGTLAIAGASLVSIDTASAQIGGGLYEPAPVIQVIEMPGQDEMPEIIVDRIEDEMGPGYLDGDFPEDDFWFDGDDCPPCGMG